MKMAVFWPAVMMEAASTSETSINFNHTTRRNKPEDSHLRRMACYSAFTNKVERNCHFPAPGRNNIRLILLFLWSVT
jgi:hypothetical protein